MRCLFPVDACLMHLDVQLYSRELSVKLLTFIAIEMGHAKNSSNRILILCG